MKHPRGISLITVTVGSLLAAGFILFLAQIISTHNNTQKLSALDNESTLESANLLQHILQTGRLAQTCQKIVSGAAVSLQCEVDFAMPALGNLTTVRFYWAGQPGLVRYQTKEGTTWKDTINYGSTERPVVAFELCDTAQLDATNPTCPLQPVALSRGIGRLLASMQTKAPPENFTNRFFRFAISVARDTKNDKPPQIIQSAFFLRNPTSIDGLTYQWGMLN